MVRLIRLQRRLGWSFAVLDRALVAAGATDLDADVLEKLATARELASRLDRPLVELLVLWAPTRHLGHGQPVRSALHDARGDVARRGRARPSSFARIGSELAETGDSLDASRVGAARGLPHHERGARAHSRAADAARRARRGSTSPACPPSIAWSSWRARFSCASPALDLAAAADAARGGSVSPRRSRRHAPLRRDRARRAGLGLHAGASRLPVPARVGSAARPGARCRRRWKPVLGSIRRGLADAFAETSRPAEVTGDTLRQKLGAPSRSRRCSIRRWRRSTRGRRRRRRPRREFFDRHLARIFPDPAAAAVRLFAAAASRHTRATRSSTLARRRSTSCSSTCCRNCGRASCAAPSSRRSSDTLGLSVPGDGAPARRRAALARANRRAAAPRLPGAARHRPHRRVLRQSRPERRAGVVRVRSRARRSRGAAHRRPTGVPGARVQRPLDRPSARAAARRRTPSTCRPTARSD